MYAKLLGFSTIAWVLCGAAFGCSSSGGNASSSGDQLNGDGQPAAEFTECTADSDCEAVKPAACCFNGKLVAVAKDKADDYAATRPQVCNMMCAEHIIPDTRVAVCQGFAEGANGAPVMGMPPLSKHCAMVAKPSPGAEGGMCGGLAGIKCAAGLDCQIPNSFPDADGTCVKAAPKPGEEGGMCGGLAGIKCAAGLDCQIPNSFPDADGTCVKAAPKPGEEGGMCGGLANIKCNPGLVCQFSGTCCDLPGVCVQQ
jgi:hypothetical protein